MKREKWKRIFSRENVVLLLIPEVGVFLVMLALIILSVLSVQNRVAEVCLTAAAFIFLVWLIFGICYLSLRGKSGKRKAAGIVLVAAMCILLVCYIALLVWNNAVSEQIERLRAMWGNAEWSSATAEELAHAESLNETLRNTIPMVNIVTMLVAIIGGVFLRDWRSGEAENPPQKDIDQNYYLQ